MANAQARSMMGHVGTALNRGSPTNHMLFAQPASSGLQTSANPSTVFLLTSSAPESVTFSQGVQSPTFLTQIPGQVFHGTSTTSAVSLTTLCHLMAYNNVQAFWIKPPALVSLAFHAVLVLIGPYTAPFLHSAWQCRQ